MRRIITSRLGWVAVLCSLLSAAAAYGDDGSLVHHVAGAETIDALHAKKLFDAGVPFIDVRGDKDWVAGRVPGAEHQEAYSVFSRENLAALVRADQAVVIYCNGSKSRMSADAVEYAVEWGFQKVYYFRGGFPEWQLAGYPIE